MNGWVIITTFKNECRVEANHRYIQVVLHLKWLLQW